MSNHQTDSAEIADADRLIAAITATNPSEGAQFRAFHAAIRTGVTLPCEAFVIGEPVQLTAIDYDGRPRQGLRARCRRTDGTEHVVAASDVFLAPGVNGAFQLEAYRRWLGEGPRPEHPKTPARAGKRPEFRPADLAPDLEPPVELVILSVKGQTAQCRPLGSTAVLTWRPSEITDLVPGEIAVVQPRKQWRYAGHAYLSGTCVSVRLDIPGLGLEPLRLEERGLWTPVGHYWGEPGEPIEEWARPILASGARPDFEMEQVLPGMNPEDPDSDPVGRANDLRESGDFAAAVRALMGLCRADLRCLDAHAHLGCFIFDREPRQAIRHYEVGVRIGELSLGPGFRGVLQWHHIDNRPFLRCLHGYGLCLWRLGQFEEAGRVFERMLWLNPSDNQGARCLLADVKSRVAWEPGEP